MTDEELLAAVAAPAVEHELDEETGQVILLQPRFRWGWVQRLLAPSPDKRHVRIHLDDLGTWVWQRLDGEVPLGHLAEGIAEAFPAEPEAERRLVLFVRQLAANRLITLRDAPRDS
jgi:hypothetical protein